MGTLRNVVKVVATIIVGYIVGLILGSILGAIFGMFISFFVQDIASPQQAVSFSILISVILGGLMSLFVAQVFNALLETNINPFVGTIPGALTGLFLVIFVDGYITISDMTDYYFHATIQSWAATPIMPYCSTIGRQLGSIIFPLFGVVGVIWDIVQSHLQLQRNRELIKNSPPEKWGLSEIPRYTSAIQPQQTTRSFPSLPNLNPSAQGKVSLLILKAFAITCMIGVILSTLGWQILGWHSSTQFSEGLFWASAILAIYGYFNRPLLFISRYGETAGDMNIHERTRQWAVEAKKSFELSPTIFLISTFLFGFSILVSIIF